MKLLAYQLSGQTVGTQIETWETNDLNNNEPFLILENSDIIPTGYTDISSIENWGKFGLGVSSDFGFFDTRKAIQELMTPAQISGSTFGLTTNEIDIIENFNIDKYYKLYDYFLINNNSKANVKEPPYNIDYNLLDLFKKRTFRKGLLEKTEYFSDYNFTTNEYSNLVVEENREFFRINELVNRRETNIVWYLNDGTSGATKHTTKRYTIADSLRAGEQRRSNIIIDMKINVMGLYQQISGMTYGEARQEGLKILNDYGQAITLYKEGDEIPLKEGIANDTKYDILDEPVPNTGGTLDVRAFLLDGLEIDYTENNTYI